MTQQEILSANGVHTYDDYNPLFESVKKSMTQYAEQESIAFAEWVEKGPYIREDNGNWKSFAIGSEEKTTAQLYAEFKRHNP